MGINEVICNVKKDILNIVDENNKSIDEKLDIINSNLIQLNENLKEILSNGINIRHSTGIISDAESSTALKTNVIQTDDNYFIPSIKDTSSENNIKTKNKTTANNYDDVLNELDNI